jgi:hypothetical protein
MQAQISKSVDCREFWCQRFWHTLRSLSVHAASAAAILTLGLCLGPARAVAQIAAAKPVAAVTPSGARASAPAQAANAPAGQAITAPGGNRRAGGPHEGIRVHGHWVIEVRNPDGKVTARREFENAIQPAGMTYLASLLSGNNSPGALSVMLNGASSTFAAVHNGVNIDFLPASGPCSGGVVWEGVGNPSIWEVLFGAFGTAGGPCLITTPANASGYSGLLAAACLANYRPAGVHTYPNPCSPSLSITGPTTTAGNNGDGLAAGFSLSGSVPVSATNAGNITDVETVLESCDASTSPAACATEANSANESVFGDLMSVNLFTEKLLDGQNGDPVEVPYSPGQTIAVTVTISFQ